MLVQGNTSTGRVPCFFRNRREDCQQRGNHCACSATGSDNRRALFAAVAVDGAGKFIKSSVGSVINVQPRTRYSRTRLCGYWLRCRARPESSWNLHRFTVDKAADHSEAARFLVPLRAVHWHNHLRPDRSGERAKIGSRGVATLDLAIKYCVGAPSFPAFYAGKGGKECHSFLAGSIV
jgi:hypothetical protein